MTLYGWTMPHHLSMPGLSLASPAGRSRSHEVRALLGSLAFNGSGAIAGGIGLLTDTLGMPNSMLDGTVFDSYTIPAWILILVVGGSSIVTSVMVWKRLRNAAETAIIAGVILLGWIVTEFVLIPEAWLPQLLFFLIAIAILALGIRMYVADTPQTR